MNRVGIKHGVSYQEMVLVLNRQTGRMMRSDALSTRDIHRFFGMRPCVLKDGYVSEYLNWEYTDDGEGIPLRIPAEIDGIVMIEYSPRQYYIEQDGNLIFVWVRRIEPYHTIRKTVNRALYDEVCAEFQKGTPPIFHHKDGDIRPFYVSMQVFPDYAEIINEQGPGYDALYWMQWLYLQIIYLFETGTTSGNHSSTGKYIQEKSADEVHHAYLVENGILRGSHDRRLPSGEYVRGIFSDDLDQGTVTVTYPDSCDHRYETRDHLLVDDDGFVISIQATDLGFFPDQIVSDRNQFDFDYYYYKGVDQSEGCLVNFPWNIFAFDFVNTEESTEPLRARLMYF